MGNYYGMSGGGGGGYPQMQMMYPRQYNPYQMVCPFYLYLLCGVFNQSINQSKFYCFIVHRVV